MGQEAIENFHKWSIILGVMGGCGFLLLAALFIKFQYGTACRKWMEKRRSIKQKNGKRARAFLMAAILLASSLSGLSAQAVSEQRSGDEDRLGESAAKVLVAVEGDSVRPNVYRDMAVAEITFQEKNFDESSVLVTVSDETGRETRLTFEDGSWKGLSGLGEGKLEMVPYGTTSENEGGKEKHWFLDSEAGVLEHTEDRTVKIRLRFPEEGRFEIREASCKDLAGNTSGLAAPVSVIIDRTPPELRIVLPEEELVHEGYYSHPITIWLYLREHNFSPEAVEGLPEMMLEIQNEEKTGWDECLEAGETGTWALAPEKGTDWYKLPIHVTEDGNYRLQVSYEDPAGRPLSAGSEREQSFTVDTTAPEFGTITAMGKSWNTLLEHITFGHYSSDQEPVILEGRDSVSPVEPLRYFCSDQVLTEHELQGVGEEQWRTGNSLMLTPDSRTVVYLRVTNYAGLDRYFSSEGLVVENKGPIITLEPRGESWAESGIYRGDVEILISLEEPEETGIVSGLKEAAYVLEAERDGRRERLKEGSLLDVVMGGAGVDEPLKHWKDRMLLSAEDYDGEDLWLTISAEDMAGNKSEKALSFSMDKTAPKLQIVYGEEQPENGFYYNRERRIQLVIEEANFSEERVWFTITNTDGALPEMSEWSHEETLHRCQLIFSEDGDYTFSVRCEDLAGHSSEREEKNFTIDRTPPKVSVEFSKEGRTGDGRYYRKPGTMEITVEEHNFDGEQVIDEMTALLDQGENRSWKANAFDSRGDIHTASLNFSEDGDYEFALACTDLAGNEEEAKAEAQFSVDQTPPSIEILGLEPESANRGAVEAEIRFEDKRLIPGTATVEVSRLDQGDERQAYQYQELPRKEGEVIKKLLSRSFPKTEDADGLYLLRAAGEDRAGNQTEKEFMFSVNRYGSVYGAFGETRNWLAGGEYPYLPEEREVIIREYNVDPVEDFQVSLSRNGVVCLLSEGKNFQREALLTESPSGRWQVYEYRIKKGVFEQEGDYELLFHSTDKAGNHMGNESTRKKGRERIFAFSVDKTGPSAVLSGAEDGGRYRADTKEVFLDIRDNMQLERVEVRTKDEKNSYEGEQLEQVLSEEGIRVKLSEEDDWQTLALYAEDAAGNRLELGNGRKTGAAGCLEWEFLITSDWWVQYCRSPLRFALLLLPAGGLLAAFAAARRRRKRKGNHGTENHGQTSSFVIK